MCPERTRIKHFRVSPPNDQSPLVALLGVATSSENRGVHALGASLGHLFHETLPGAELVLLASHDRHEKVSFPGARESLEISVVPARLSPKSARRDHLLLILLGTLLHRGVPSSRLGRRIERAFPWVGAVGKAKIVGDIRGGDSFTDLYGVRRFLLGFLMAWSVILVRGEIVQFPQTYGPYRRRLSRVLARYILRRSSVILARDPGSRNIAQALVGGRREVLLCPDVAFALPAGIPETVELDGVAVSFKSFSTAGEDNCASVPPLGLNVNGLMYNGGYTRRNMFGLKLDYPSFLPSLVEALLREHPGEIWLIPHTYGPPQSVESDPEACRRVQEALSEDLRPRVRRITGEYDCCRLKGIIGACGFFIGSRMHSCIAALSQGIPTVGIAYSDKFRGVFETVGMEDCVVDARATSPGEAFEKIITAFRARNARRKPLQERAAAARKQLAEVFRSLAAEALHQDSRV